VNADYSTVDGNHVVCPSPFYKVINTPRAALTLAPETPSTSNF